MKRFLKLANCSVKKEGHLLNDGIYVFHTQKRNYTQIEKKHYVDKLMTAEEAILKYVRGGKRVFMHTACGMPKHLVKTLEIITKPENEKIVFGNKIEKVECTGVHINYYPGELPPQLKKSNSKYFRTNSLFIGPHERVAHKDVNYQDTDPLEIDSIPAFLSEMPNMIKSKAFHLDIAFIQVSPPDAHGYCSLGISIDHSLTAAKCADIVIAQINKNYPRSHGDGYIHLSEIDALVEFDEEVTEIPITPLDNLNPTEKLIGENIAQLIPNGATLQLGVGEIPNAVAAALMNHKNLGIHTELFERGVITNTEKTFLPNVMICTFAMGTQKLYKFIHDNPNITFKGSDFVNEIENIKKNKNMIAVNSAIEIDLTGQVCSDSIGTRIYSGFGGQVDFTYGTSKAEGGKPIIAMTSTTSNGESKISSMLKLGAGVVTTRAHIHYVVTEYGVASLYGKNFRQRAKELIKIAHPNHRERLMFEANKRFGYL